MTILRVLLAAAVLAGVCLPAQDDAKQRIKAVRDLGKGGSEAIPRIEPYLSDPKLDVRVEAVKSIVEIGTVRSLDPLIKATNDNDAEVQIRATDGLVNFYLPGYIRTGLTASLRRMGSSIKGVFTETNDQVIDAFVTVRPEVIRALGRLVRSGSSMDVRANAARAIGILRGRQAIPDLSEALRSKDSQVIYESLIALEKIRDPSAGPSVVFLIRDLDEKVQTTAIEAVGLLLYHGAINDLRDVLDRTKKIKVKRAALTALALLPEEQLHGLYVAYLDNADDGLRVAAAEGLGRFKNQNDRPKLEEAFKNEKKTGTRLAMAFALADLGELEMGDFDPLRYLLNTLNSNSYRPTARAYLIELAREPRVRKALYPALSETSATREEKTGMAEVLAQSGGSDSIPTLDTLSKDLDKDVSQGALRALRSVRARI